MRILSALPMMVPLCALATGINTGHAGSDGWRTYSNPRFGAQADVPVGDFTQLPQPSNGDGLKWVSSDGLGELSVYGSHGGAPSTWTEYQKMMEGLSADTMTITYRASGEDWFVISGHSGGRISYLKAVRSPHCEFIVANHIFLEYPADQKQRYDSIARRMAKSLTSVATDTCPGK